MFQLLQTIQALNHFKQIIHDDKHQDDKHQDDNYESDERALQQHAIRSSDRFSKRSSSHFYNIPESRNLDSDFNDTYP